MPARTPSTGSIFLTAAQSLQTFQRDMQLVEQVNREGGGAEAGDPGHASLQQTPAASSYDNERRD